MDFNICFSPTILLLLYKSCYLMYGANAILWFSNFLKIRNWLFRLIFTFLIQLIDISLIFVLWVEILMLTGETLYQFYLLGWAFAFSSCQFTNYQIPFLSGWFFPILSVFIWGHHISGNSHPERVSSNQIGKRVSYRSRYNSQDWLINIWEW